MSETEHNTLTRLRAANPARVQADLGRSEVVQATLRRILAGPAAAPERRRGRGWWSRVPGGGVGVALAVVVIGGGAAVAATDPFGWTSANPNTAKYEVSPALRVRAPSIAEIVCRSGRGTGLICTPGGSGQRYMRAETIAPAPPSTLFTRAHFIAAIARAEARHRLSSAAAAKIREDIARVPDSFFVELRLATHYQTIGTADGRVPPAGVPEWVVCQDAPSALSCQNLNGDRHVPVGAAIYSAQPAPGWRKAPRTPPDYGVPPGIRFTRAEYPLLADMVRYVSTSGSTGGRSVGRPVPRRAASTARP